MKSSENYKSMLNFRNAMEKVLSAYSETVIYTDFIAEQSLKASEFILTRPFPKVTDSNEVHL